MSSTRRQHGRGISSKQIRITAIPRKPIDVAGLVSALVDLAAQIAKDTNQDRPARKDAEEDGRHG